jgi:predicted phosphoribosyltransferase
MDGHIFDDRVDAGQRLAEKLEQYAGHKDVIVLALPRGGVPVAYEVAKYLGAPLDVFLVRKLGVPGHEEYAMGAIAMGGVEIINQDIVRQLDISREAIDNVAQREQEEMRRRDQVYRQGLPFPDLTGKTVIIVDDGLATGATMRAAATAVFEHNPAKVIIAVPTGSPEVCQAFEALADEVVCLSTPDPFRAVGAWYRDFSQTTDEEVRELMQQANAEL